MNNRTIVIMGVVVIIVLLVGVVLYIRNQSSQNMLESVSQQEESSLEPNAEQSPADNNAIDSAESAIATGQVKEFIISGSSFKLEPATLTVNKGDKVKITFKNSGGSHDFVIDEFNITTKVLQSGQQETVEFTADKTGSFEYYCSVDNHKAMGMKGTLVVQ